MKTAARRTGHQLSLHELSVAFLALNLVDVALTCWLLEHGGVEVNPILCGADGWPAMKLCMASTCALFVVLWNRPRVMRLLVIGMAVVVGWNLAMTGVALW